MRSKNYLPLTHSVSWRPLLCCCLLGKVETCVLNFSIKAFSVAIPPARGCHVLRPMDLVPPSFGPVCFASTWVPVHPRKTVGFKLLPNVPVWLNRHWSVWEIRTWFPCSPLFLLWGVQRRIDVRHSVPTADPHLYSTGWLPCSAVMPTRIHIPHIS